MKKWLAMALFAAMLGTCASAQEFTGEASGFGGKVSVTISVENGEITACSIEADDETPSIGGQAVESLAAGIAETGEVEAVSGATMTSNAVAAALQDAMEQAGLVQQETADMQPGTYTGSAHGFSCIDEITVQVTVDETSILSIELEDTFQMDRDSYENPYMAKGAFAELQPAMLAEQSIGVDSVTGATGSSTGIKNAVRDALEQAFVAAGLSDADAANAVTAKFAKAPAAPEQKQETLTCDVVVVGAGASGTIASLTAQEAGLNVVNIEKTFRWGGQSMLTGGPKVFSPLTDEATIEATVEEYEEVNDNSRFGTDAVWNDPEYREANGFIDFNHDAYRAVIAASGNGVKTLIRGGVEFSEGIDFSEMGAMMEAGPGSATPGGEAAAETGAGVSGGTGSGAGDMAALMAMSTPAVTLESVDSYTSGQNVNYVKAEEGYEKAYQKFVDMGGTALLRTEATELIYDDDGTIVGVRAQADDGTEYSVMAQCVILATGGFGGNDEMVEQYTPGGSDWIYYGWQGNDGAGIQMALDAGANPYHMDAYPMSHQRMGAEFVTVFDVQQTETGELWSPNDLAVVLAVNDDGVYVTSDGTPFKTEDIHSSMGGFSGSMASYYLGSRYYVVYSATQLEAYANSGIADTTMGFQNTGEGVPAGYALGDWVDTVLEYAASRGWAWKVSSLAEGDAAIGLPEGTLEAAYAADATELNRAGDTYYYVMACTGLSISSCGGVEVNEKMQAVRTDGSAIENLFVVGNDSFGNIMSTGAEYSIGGDAGMWCMGSADVAAKTAIEMVTAQ